MRTSGKSSQEVALLQKDIELHKMMTQKAELEIKNNMQHIEDMKIQQKNEIKLIKDKVSREFESQLEDEKHAI